MLYYGDRARELAPRDVLGRVSAALHRASGLRGEAREEPLVAALVEAGQLAQGLADRAFEERGHDDPDPAADAALALTVAIARRACAAWRGDGALQAVPPVGGMQLVRRLSAMRLPSSVRVTVPEGYAHYALHPILYAEAAKAVAGLPGRVVVVGIRSIGTSLAATVAAAVGARDVLTVRPNGHPYQRAITAGAALQRRIAEHAAAGAVFAVVDEGPGLSGSSFDATCAWVRDSGVEPHRILALPSHAGPLGPAAPDERRARWARTGKYVASFDDVVLPRLRGAAERVLGAVDLQDLSGGRWRARAPVTGAAATIGPVCNPEGPPVFGRQERRKYLATSPPFGGQVLLRFAGIGPYGDETFARAVALAEAGFAPAVVGLLHGFLARTWLAGSWAERARHPPPSDRVAAYIAFRARAFPARPGDGATPERLLEMLRVNATEAVGPAAAAGVGRLERGAREVEPLARIAVDGKMERWEWLTLADGTAMKGDAVDHAFGHDLIGCQPAAWDVAGARIELGLGRDAAIALSARVSPGSTAGALAFLEAAYLAHRVGRWTFALQLEDDLTARAAIASTLDRYTVLLRERLASGSRP